MLISLDWLKQYVDIEGKSIEELENSLTMIGQEVEAIEEKGKNLDNVVVGQVVKYAKHPESEHLSLCMVEVGEEKPLQIVCGATNHKEGDKVAVAKIGAVLPGNFKIKKAKVRNQESFGMMCSEKELGISEANDGIMILDQNAPIGKEIKEYLELNDVMFELEITPNRPDCLSHIGIARELSAYYDSKMKYPLSNLRENTERTATNIKIEIEDKELCKRYSARIIKNIKVEESPAWLKKRLQSIGLRSINNIVDITNFVMMEYNHPMHAFDYNKIEGKKIIVRKAKEDEKIFTLDKEERTLDGELVIADEVKPIAIAGIMGGANSEVDNNTKDILLEVAYFTPENIRKTSKKLGLSSDSSYRFERGVDINDAEEVIDRAASLIQELAGGEVLQGLAEKHIEKYEKRTIALKLDKLNKFIGKEISKDKVGKILSNLDIEINNLGENQIIVSPPSYRTDILRAADLYEEVIRMYGFENIEPIMPISDISAGQVCESIKLVDRSKEILKNIGLQEVINYSFIPENAIEKIKFTEDIKFEKVKNPINEDMTLMRPTLIYSILANIKDNFNRNIFDIKVFEVSRVFEGTEGKLAKETNKAIIGLAGRDNKNLWEVKPEAYDFYDLKGYVEEFLMSMGLKNYQVNRIENSTFHPGRSAGIYIGRDLIAEFGEIHPDVLENMEIDREKVYIAEICIEKVNKYAKTKIKYEGIVKFPAVERDLAIVVDEEVLVGNMIKDIEKTSNLIEKVELFDVYQGKGVEENKKSIAVNIIMRSKLNTLKEEEVNKTVSDILITIDKKYKGKLRQ